MAPFLVELTRLREKAGTTQGETPGTKIAQRHCMTTRDELLAKAKEPAEKAMKLHPFYRGKIQTALKCPVRGLGDFAIWYTPGVAAPCRAIEKTPGLVYEHTNKGNTIAIVSDGSRVLGLGDIGPEAGLPVMEGKALLFKYLGGVDAVPLCIAADSPERIIETVRALEPSFGGINLEDISQPKCFRVLDELRETMGIPVWHDDEQGSATVLLAGMLNALEVVGKSLSSVKIAMIGFGAANVASYRLLTAAGVDPSAIVACDTRGTLHRNRSDIESQQETFKDKWKACQESNADAVVGGIEEAMVGADVCIAFSAPGPEVIDPDWIRRMSGDAIVFACANPIPEIWPWDAEEAGARIVATGRSDFENQVNNSLGFPGIFRGVLDVRARTISPEMAIAAAKEIAAAARDRGISDDDILPRMDEWEVYPRIAAATGMKAQEQGLAKLTVSREALLQRAYDTIKSARAATELMMKEGLILPPPK
jgi:malate dehydrogenase (oxaloacetate-decarboxylating)